MGRTRKETSESNGNASTVSERAQVSMTDVKRMAKGIKKALKTLNKLAETNSTVKKVLNESGLHSALTAEVDKLKNLAMKLALAEFEAE
jgi:hypothetical protein